MTLFQANEERHRKSMFYQSLRPGLEVRAPVAPYIATRAPVAPYCNFYQHFAIIEGHYLSPGVFFHTKSSCDLRFAIFHRRAW